MNETQIVVIIMCALIGVMVFVALNISWLSHLIMYRTTKNKKGHISLKTLFSNTTKTKWETETYAGVNNFSFTYFPQIPSLFKYEENIMTDKLHANLIKFDDGYYWTDLVTYYIVVWYLFFNTKKLNRREEK